MSETIKPALTPEEWEKCSTDRNGGDGDVEFDAEGQFVMLYDSGFGQNEITDAHRHAIAALALHGLPEGFTHEDVDRLYTVMEWVERVYGKPDWDIDMMRDLAARIAALLPPRE